MTMQARELAVGVWSLDSGELIASPDSDSREWESSHPCVPGRPWETGSKLHVDVATNDIVPTVFAAPSDFGSTWKNPNKQSFDASCDWTVTVIRVRRSFAGSLSCLPVLRISTRSQTVTIFLDTRSVTVLCLHQSELHCVEGWHTTSQTTN